MKRILSALLCIMFIVTTLPMVAMATEEETFETIRDVAEKYAGITDYNSYAYWSMTEKIPSGSYGFIYTPHNATIDSEKGTYINSSAGTDHMFRYTAGETFWSPLEQGKRFVYFKAQVSEADKLEVYVEDSQGLHKKGSFIITAAEFSEMSFSGLYSTREGGAGTEMMEYLIVNDSGNMVKLFTKGAKTDNKWVLAANAYGWTGENEDRGLYIVGTGYVKDVTLYEKTVTYTSPDEIAGKFLYSTPSYEQNTETTTDTGQRYTGPIGPAISKGMVPVFRAKLDDADSSMRIAIRKLGETSATYNSYEFTVTADGITSNAPLVYLNGDFSAGTEYVDYALFVSETECKVYARVDGQFGDKWVHIVTDKTASSTDNSYGATPVIWATTGSFTVDNLKIYQPMESYESIEDIVGLESVVATKRFDLTQKITDKTGFSVAPTSATVDVENGTLIDSSITNGVFRYNNGDDFWSSLETGKRFAYFTAKTFEDKALEVYLQDVSGNPRRGSFKISATEFKESGFANDTEFSRPGGAGADWVEYLLVSTNANYVNLYAKSPSLTNDEWVLVCTASGWAGSNEKSNGLYITGKGYVKEIVLYEKLESYESLNEIAGENLLSMSNYEKNEESTIAEGERYTGLIPLSTDPGVVPTFRAKLNSADSSMRIVMRRPGETAANTSSYEFTVAAENITANAALTYVNEEFKAGTDYVEYALFASATECKVYARSDGQFDGKWVHIVTDVTPSSTDTSYYATPAIWATTGSFTLNNIKYFMAQESFETIEKVVGLESVVATKRFDLTEKITDKTGFAVAPTGATVDAENGTLIDSSITNGVFRYNNGDDFWSSLETGKRFAYFTAKTFEDQALEVFVQDVSGNPRRGSFKISATEFKESGFINDTEFSRPGGAGADWVEYLLVSSKVNYVNLYAKSPSLTDGKWVLVCTASGWYGDNEKSNGLYFSGKGYVKEVVLYEKLESYESLNEIAGENLISMSDYENNEENTIAEGERYTGPIPLSTDAGVVPTFRAKLNSDDSLMRVIIRRPGETAANTTSYEFTVSAENITANAALTYVNEEFKAGTDYVEYALFASATECKVYARSDGQFDGKWVHIITDVTPHSTDTSYYATPVIWATTGSFTLNSIKYFKPLDGYETVDDVLGYVSKVAREYDLTTSNYGEAVNPAALEKGVGVKMNGGGYWRVGGDGKSALGTGKAIYFRAKADEGKNSYFYLHIPDESKTEAAYCFMLNENGIGTTDNASHKTYCYEASGSHVDFAPGTEFAEYLAIDNEDGTGLHIYARQDGLYGGKWVQTSRIIGHFPSLSAKSEFYMTVNGVLSSVKMYEKNTYSSINDILGYDVKVAKNYDLTNSNYGEAVNPAALEKGVGVKMNNGGYWRVGGDGKSALGTGKVIYFRAKAEEGKNSYIYLHIPDETKAEATYCFMLNENGIGTTDVASHKAYCYEASGSHVDFAPGTEFAEYLAIDNEDGTGLHIYARQEGLYNGEWVQTSRIVGYFPSLSAKSEFYMTSNGVLSAVKMYNEAEFYTTVAEVVGESMIETKTFTDFMRYTPNSTYSPLTNGAVTFSATACEDGKAITVYIHDPNTEKNAYAFKITKEGLFKSRDNASQNIVMNENFVPGTEVHDYLVVENETKDGLLVYVKNEESKWAPVFEITGHTLDTPYTDTYGLYIFSNEEGSKAVLHNAAIYASADTVDTSGTIPEGATNLYFEDDFSGSRDYKKQKSGSVVENGVVSIEEMGYYSIPGISIPAGGYAEFKLTGNDITEFYIGDSTSRFNWNIGSTDVAERIWRIVRSADGGLYTGYWCPADNQSAWVKGFEEAADVFEDGKTKLEFNNNGTGMISVDYLKVYVPDGVIDELIGDEKLVLVDGMGQNSLDLTDGPASAEYKTITAMVRQGAEKELLLVAEYRQNGSLSKIVSQEVPAGDKVTSFIYDIRNDVQKTKVFLWDGLENINSILDASEINY